MDPVIKTGQPAPDFSLPDLHGKNHTLSEQRGKLLVVNFWSAECPWAERADKLLQPRLIDWGEDVVLLPVASNANEGLEMLLESANQRGLDVVLHDAEQQVAQQYGARTTPHVFLVDGQGLLRYQGAVDDVTFRQPEPTRNYLIEVVEALLDGNDPALKGSPPYGCTVVYHEA